MSVHEQITNLVSAAALLGVGLTLVVIGLVMAWWAVNHRR